MDKIIDSLVKQGTEAAQKGAVVLPHWVYAGAKLVYVSRTSGESLDVVVKGVSQSKREVRFVFKGSESTWKSISFEQLLCGNSPLRPKEGAARPPPAKCGGDEKSASKGEGEADPFESFLTRVESKWRDSRRSGGKTSGPALNKIPQAWKQPEVVEIDDCAQVDLSSSPERRAPEAGASDNVDPYGLGEGSLPESTTVGQGGACKNQKQETGSRKRRGESEKRRRSADRSSGDERGRRPRGSRSEERRPKASGKKRGGSRSRSRNGSSRSRRSASGKARRHRRRSPSERRTGRDRR